MTNPANAINGLSVALNGGVQVREVKLVAASVRIQVAPLKWILPSQPLAA
jgi:hypothetical protein